MPLEIENIKNAGYQVKINHFRPFITYWNNPSPTYQRMVQKIVYLPGYHKRNKKWTLISKGGYTTLSVSKDGLLLAESLAICSDSDVFCFATGRNEALDKLNKQNLNL